MYSQPSRLSSSQRTSYNRTSDRKPSASRSASVRNMFINFQRGNTFHTRGYDSLSSSARKNEIIKKLEYIANINTTESSELEETTIAVKIGKSAIQSTRKYTILLHSIKTYLHSLTDLEIFKN